MATLPPSSGPAAQTPAPDRLDSWKAIAAYLNRDVRTVQRWEVNERLPVHRHLHQEGSTVYAIASELDRWCESRRIRSTPHDSNQVSPQLKGPGGVDTLEPVTRRFTGKRIWKLAALSALGIGVAAAVLLTFRWQGWNLVANQPSLHLVATLDTSFAHVAPNGRWMAYQDAANPHLWLQDLRDGSTRIVADTPTGVVDEVAWSPDSRRLAYTTRGDGPRWQIELLDLSTGQHSLAWEGDGPRLEPVEWSRDASKLLCLKSLGSTGKEWNLLALYGGVVQSIIRIPPQSNWPRLSPDGRYVVYASARQDGWNIYAAPTDGSGRETQLTTGKTLSWRPLWSPSGRYIVYVTDQGSSSALWSIRFDLDSGKRLGDPALITHLPSGSSIFEFSADHGIFFYHGKQSANIDVFDLDVVTGLPRKNPSISLEAGSESPVWSRDGRTLYFRGLHADSSFLLSEVKNLDTGETRSYRPPDAYQVLFSTMTRDGRGITFYGWDQNRARGIYQYTPELGTVSPLWLTNEAENPPLSWSPNDDELLFSSAPDKADRLPVRILNRRSGQVRTIAWSRGRPFPHWSPDAHEIAFTDGNCLRVVSRSGGSPHEITCTDPASPGAWVGYLGAGAMTWSPDGSKIAWTVHDEVNRRVDLWMVDRATGKHSIWEGMPDYSSWMKNPAWSPDGKRIAAGMNFKPQYEIWQISGGLPH